MLHFADPLARGRSSITRAAPILVEAPANIALFVDTSRAPASGRKATDVVSNQYLFNNSRPLADLGDLTELHYIDARWICADHNQFVTGSAVSRICGTGRAIQRT
jgi:hypothetical protein